MAQAWSFVGAGAVSTGSSLSLAVPAGYAEGDMLIIVVGNTSAPATPSGWTVIENEGTHRIALFYKAASSSESTVNISTTLGTGVMIAYRAITQFDVLGTYDTDSGTTSATTSLTTTAADDLVVSVYRSTSTNSLAWTGVPTDTTSRVNRASSAGNYGGLLVVDENMAVAGATTVRTAMLSGSDPSANIAFSFRQAAGVSGMLLMFN